ncbi:MAG: class E sortase [Microbacteriaceae bacterium]|nr:class E sortase [Microbacteriaceae bacterium]
MGERRGGAGTARRSRRRRLSVVGVLGEIFITAGVFTLLFLGWQLWLNDIIVGNEMRDQSEHQSALWQGNASTAEEDPSPPTPDEPPVADKPGSSGEVFALMIVPRFGKNFYTPIAEGVGTTQVLNRGEIGHYPTSSLPGEVGNFAVAAHRTSFGKPFNNIANLRVGDHIYIETADGWYQYGFRNLEYVRPTGVGVLLPVPQNDGATPGDRILTMTSCNPLFSAAERIIAYSVYETFYPRTEGPPAEIAGTVLVGD